MITLGISGFAESGKDAIADAACLFMKELGYNCIKVPFAYKLKKIVIEKHNIGKIGSGSKAPLEREQFQYTGESGRSFYGELWIDLAKARILELLVESNIPLDDKLVVIHSDVRHINESKFIFSSKVNSLFCVNSDTRQGHKLDDDMYKHESEIHIPEIRSLAKDHERGFIIYNNGLLKNTIANLKDILYFRYAVDRNTKMLDMCKDVLWKNKM